MALRVSPGTIGHDRVLEDRTVKVSARKVSPSEVSITEFGPMLLSRFLDAVHPKLRGVASCSSERSASHGSYSCRRDKYSKLKQKCLLSTVLQIVVPFEL